MPDTPAERAYLAATGETILGAKRRAGIRAAVSAAEEPGRAILAAARRYAAACTDVDRLSAAWRDLPAEMIESANDAKAEARNHLLRLARETYAPAPAGAIPEEGK